MIFYIYYFLSVFLNALFLNDNNNILYILFSCRTIYIYSMSFYSIYKGLIII